MTAYRAQLARPRGGGRRLHRGDSRRGLMVWFGIMFFPGSGSFPKLVITAALRVILLAGIVRPLRGRAGAQARSRPPA